MAVDGHGEPGSSLSVSLSFRLSVCLSLSLCLSLCPSGQTPKKQRPAENGSLALQSHELSGAGCARGVAADVVPMLFRPHNLLMPNGGPAAAAAPLLGEKGIKSRCKGASGLTIGP